jgi:hypothetical protein
MWISLPRPQFDVSPGVNKPHPRLTRSPHPFELTRALAAAVGGLPLLAGLAGAGEPGQRLRVAQRCDRPVLRHMPDARAATTTPRTGTAPRA